MAQRALLFRIISFFIYIFVGGAIFMQIEQDGNEKTGQVTLWDLKSEWMKKYNLSNETVMNILRDYESLKTEERKPHWTFGNAVFFVVQLSTTIGYGNITPTTSFGQIFTIFYAIIGIPIAVLALKSTGELLNTALKVITRPLHRRFHGTDCSEQSCNYTEKGGICANLTILISIWILASLANAFVDRNLELVSNVYSIFISYSTVGFGDFIPFKNHTYAIVLWILPGLSLMSSLIDSVVSCVEKNKTLGKCRFNMAGCLQGRGRTEVSDDGSWSNDVRVGEESV